MSVHVYIHCTIAFVEYTHPLESGLTQIRNIHSSRVTNNLPFRNI